MPPPRSDRAATLESVPFSRKGKAHASAFCISRQTPQEAGEVHKRRRFCTQVSSKRLRQPARCCLYQLGGVQRHLRRCGYKQPPAQRPTWLGQGRFATSDSEKGWLYVQDSPRGGFSHQPATVQKVQGSKDNHTGWRSMPKKGSWLANHWRAWAHGISSCFSAGSTFFKSSARRASQV